MTFSKDDMYYYRGLKCLWLPRFKITNTCQISKPLTKYYELFKKTKKMEKRQGLHSLRLDRM